MALGPDSAWVLPDSPQKAAQPLGELLAGHVGLEREAQGWGFTADEGPGSRHEPSHLLCI